MTRHKKTFLCLVITWQIEHTQPILKYVNHVKTAHGQSCICLKGSFIQHINLEGRSILFPFLTTTTTEAAYKVA